MDCGGRGRKGGGLYGADCEETGELSSVDGYMNIALEKTVEYVNGEVRNKYGDVFIRGNNGTAETSPRSVN